MTDRRVRGSQYGEATAQLQKNIVGERMLGLPKAR
jgi:hypothetical protein